MFARRPPSATATRLRAVEEIADALSGGDSLRAWNAVWDLVQSRDSQGKQELLAILKEYVETTASGPPTALAEEFADAIEGRLRPPASRERVVPSDEVRHRHQQEQMSQHRRAMHNSGARPGEGLPMWAIYMTRRSKKSWG